MASAVGESYGKTVGGKLALKGLDLGKKARAAAKKKKLKKKRKKEKKEGRGTKRDRDDAALGSGDEEEAETAPLVQRRGTGRLVTSVTSVHGKGTQFMKELTSGDAIMITHPTTFQQETRIITVVLSDISMAISSPFSSDLISATRFQYVKRPKLKVDSDAKQNKKQKAKADEEKLAFGTYASGGGETFTYRVKKPGAYGGYKIVTVKTGGGKTREELLDMRCKKKSDRLA